MLQQLYTTERIDNVILRVAERLDAPEFSLNNWTELTEDQLFCQIVRCILGSRVSYELAETHAKHLMRVNCLSRRKILANPSMARTQITKCLATSLPVKGRPLKYPFYRLRASQIVQTCIHIYTYEHTTLKEILRGAESDQDARRLIASFCSGIGMKQASLFLRNISYSENLAILDSHLLHFMIMRGLIDDQGFYLNTKAYEKYELVLDDYARGLGKTLSSLDLAIWGVMRVMEKDQL